MPEGLSAEQEVLLQRARVELLSWPLDSPEVNLLNRGIDLAVELTDSKIGYVHYVNSDQDSIELCTWSTSTAGYCTATYDRHYPISKAGIWADSARLRTPQVNNDYLAEPERRGVPQGHADVVRHLGVPVLEGDMVRLLLGVGNADQPYGSRTSPSPRRSRTPHGPQSSDCASTPRSWQGSTCSRNASTWSV